MEPAASMPVSYLSWLERHTDNVEVGSSSLPGTTGDGQWLRVNGEGLDAAVNREPAEPSSGD